MSLASTMRILVADDEEEIRESLKEIFSEEGYEILTAKSEIEALKGAETGIDLAILDIKLGVDNGIEVLKKLKDAYPQVPVIMITGFGTIALAKEAFKIGAHDFLEKPLRLIQVRTTVRNALEGVLLKKQLYKKESGVSGNPIIESAAMKQLYSQATRLSNVRETVVIMGPSGSGKDLLARHLHYEGVRAPGPFVVTNAASLPVTLAEDEFFGHERGAFTGADKKRIGCIEQAHGGTLFLDEIGDMDIQIQAKILRVLESGELVRLGGTSTTKVDVRFICATHKDLEDLVSQGKFRHDLWYRISAFVLKIPGLDARTDDIAPLCEFFLKMLSKELGIEKTFSKESLCFLSGMNFPGNVRELKHLITRLAVYTDSAEIDICDIKLQCNESSVKTERKNISDDIDLTLDFKDAKIQFEKEFLRRSLTMNQGNITATARSIGLAQSNLSRKLKELGIEINKQV
jgi:two-component system nitrogen regulation response regulator NtrX